MLHISSLPTAYGIGTLGRAAYEFVDFLKRAGQTYWQVLPMSPTGYGNSPYQSYSVFAGNPYFIDFDMLSERGNLEPSVYRDVNWGSDPENVDYGALYENRFKVLKSAYYADREEISEKLYEFRKSEAYWIEDYALFMALKYENDMISYQKWNDDIKTRKAKALQEAYERLEDEVEFWIYVQYRFFEQWSELKDYAKRQGVKIIGDMPIYVAEDSADAWAHSEELQLDKDKIPLKVAGCPPDYFSPKGQLWGNPLYNWEYLKGTGYEWWTERIKKMLKMFDVVRIDHFRAFSDYYAVPYGDVDATNGKWEEGPGKDFFDVLESKLGKNLPIIAEDLGMIDDRVRELLKYTGFPGMKILQFAFDNDKENEYLPHNYTSNCVAYIGTHDNDTLLGWLKNGDAKEVDYAKLYMRINNAEGEHIGAIKTLMASPADVSIVTMQDILALGSNARMNTPSVSDGNWCWRLTLNWVFFDNTADWIKEITCTYGR